MPKLLITASEYPPFVGGISTLINTFINELKHYPALDIHLFAPAGSLSPIHCHLHEQYDRHQGTLSLYRTCRNNALKLAKLHHQHQFDAICFMDASARMYHFSAVPNVQSLVYVHGTEVIVTSRLGELVSHRVALQRTALQRATYIAVNSKSTGRLVQRLLPQCHPKVIYPCYDPCRAYDSRKHYPNPYPSEPHTVKFLTVSRLIKSKGHKTVLKLLAILRPKLPPFQYYIAGDGPARAHLVSLAHRLNLSNQVVFLGALPGEQLPAFYRYADLFIMLPSHQKRTESFGLVFIEAGLAELVAVGSDYGGIPEAIQTGETGLLINLSNLEMAAAQILELLQDAMRREKLGKASRERALTEFSPKKFTQQILQVLDL